MKKLQSKLTPEQKEFLVSEVSDDRYNGLSYRDISKRLNISNGQAFLFSQLSILPPDLRRQVFDNNINMVKVYETMRTHPKQEALERIKFLITRKKMQIRLQIELKNLQTEVTRTLKQWAKIQSCLYVE